MPCAILPHLMVLSCSVPRIDLEKKADGVTAAVSMKHGMDWTAPHMITEVLVHDQNKKVVHKHVFDSSEDTAKTEFKVPSGTESLVAYEVELLFFCFLDVTYRTINLTALLAVDFSFATSTASGLLILSSFHNSKMKFEHHFDR
eukprot:SAG31_NODE_961_length_10749_cov_7.202160_4_plen_144_part_00